MLSVASSTLDAVGTTDLTEFLRAIASFAVVMTGILGIGLVVHHAFFGDSNGDPITETVLVLGLGICGYGALLLLLGFLPLLSEVPLTVLSVVAAGASVRLWPGLGRMVRADLDLLIGAVRREPMVALPSLGLLVLAMLAGVRAPVAADEVAYHWPAPLAWADAGHWVETPFRFTNGFHLAEVLYTPAAVFGTAISAHWLHTATFAILALGAAALARSIGAPGVLAAAATLAIPAAAQQSWLAYNDIFGAALIVAACVAVATRSASRNMWAAGVLIAGAVSVKPLLVVMAPAVPFIVLYARHQRAESAVSVRSLRSLVPLGVPTLAASIGWFGYTRAFTGTWFQSSGVVVSVFGDDPSNGLATFRVPALMELIVAPFLPVITGILGQREPFGGRTGLVLTLFIPVTLVSVFLMSSQDRRQIGRLAVPAAVTYLLAAILVVRTRFLIPVYALATASTSFTVAWWRAGHRRLLGMAIKWGFRVAVVIGLLDSARLAVR